MTRAWPAIAPLASILLASILLGCVPQFETVGCYSTAECPPAFQCVDRACVRGEVDAAVTDNGPGDAGLDAEVTPEGLSAAGQFGAAIAVLGDVNGDGFADVAIGAPATRTTGCVQECGRVYVYHGGPKGLTLPAVTIIDGVNALKTRFGERLHAPGDIDKDGFADLVVATREGPVYVFHGSADGLPSGRADRVARAALPPNDPFTIHGAALTSGDVNADGYPDLVLVARTYAAVAARCERGLATIYQPAAALSIAYGGPDGVDVPGRSIQVWQPDDEALCACPDLVSRPTVCDVGAGLAVGDLDGDGRDDVVLGAARTAADAGNLQPFFSLPDGLVAAPPLAGRCPGARLSGAGRVLAPGDWDADGDADLLAVVRGWSEDCRTEGANRLIWIAGGPQGLTREATLFEAPVDARGVGEISYLTIDDRGTLLAGQSQFDSGDGALRPRVWSADLAGARAPQTARLLLQGAPETLLTGPLVIYRATPESTSAALIGVRPSAGTGRWTVETVQLP